MKQIETVLERIERERPQAVLIAGPTASGKSGLALAIAREFGGTVINADSMQVYRELAILTARPTPADEAVAPHRLYGHVPASQAYSAAVFAAEAKAELRGVRRRGRLPIFVGGTGLYFRALEGGLSPMPQIDPAIRSKWRDFAERSPERLHSELAARDPGMAERLGARDRQRIVRALEVVESTGRSLLDWRGEASGTDLLAGMDVLRLCLDPPRQGLRERIAERFDEMLERGALAEVAALVALDLPLALPAMRAIGVRELSAHLAGNLSIESARSRVIEATGQYAKRQATWFRHQLSPQWEYTHIDSITRQYNH